MSDFQYNPFTGAYSPYNVTGEFYFIKWIEEIGAYGFRLRNTPYQTVPSTFAVQDADTGSNFYESSFAFPPPPGNYRVHYFSANNLNTAVVECNIADNGKYVSVSYKAIGESLLDEVIGERLYAMDFAAIRPLDKLVIMYPVLAGNIFFIQKYSYPAYLTYSFSLWRSENGKDFREIVSTKRTRHVYANGYTHVKYNGTTFLTAGTFALSASVFVLSILRSEDNAQTWEEISLPLSPGLKMTPRKIEYVNGVWLILVKETTGSTIHYIYRSTDDGRTWTVYLLPFVAFEDGFGPEHGLSTSNSKFYIVKNDYTVYESTNGLSWTATPGATGILRVDFDGTYFVVVTSGSPAKCKYGLTLGSLSEIPISHTLPVGSELAVNRDTGEVSIAGAGGFYTRNIADASEYYTSPVYGALAMGGHAMRNGKILYKNGSMLFTGARG